MERDRSADLMLISVSAIWGFNFVAVKFLLTQLSPVNLILFRFIIGSVLLFLLLFFFQDVKIPRKDLLSLCGIGAIGITLYQFFFTYSLKYTTVTNVSIIINTAPLYGGFLSSLFGFEKFERKRMIAVATGFVGVFILISKGSLAFNMGDLKGNLLALASSLLWAFYTILSKPLLARHSPLKVTTYSMLAGSFLLLPFTPFYFSAEEFFHLSVLGWFAIAFAIIFSVVVSFFLWYKGVAKIGPSRTLVYQYSVPVFAVLSAILLLGERIYISQCIGAAIVFVSITLARRT